MPAGLSADRVGRAPLADPVRRAKLLRRIHDLGPDLAEPSPLLRGLVAHSWRRSAAAGIDPDRPAPRILDPAEAADRLEEWPFASVLPPVAAVLGATLRDSRCLAALSDRDGLILWAEGDPHALRVAEQVRFVPGALCSESAIGTNAVGTALAIDHPVEIFSAEHYNRLLHTWTCAAAPIHDPASGKLIGAIDVSGDFRLGHLHSLGLVRAVARLAEAEIGRVTAARADRLKRLYLRRLGRRIDVPTALLDSAGRVIATTGGSWTGSQTRVPLAGRATLSNGAVAAIEPLGRRDGFIAWRVDAAPRAAARSRVQLETLGRTRLRAQINGRLLDFAPRQGAVLLLLALNPAGLTRDELGGRLYGDDCKPVTVRAEISRLRSRIGPLLRSEPYRLEAEVTIDAEDLVAESARLPASEAAQRWGSGPLPGCAVPEIAGWRERLEQQMFTT